MVLVTKSKPKPAPHSKRRSGHHHRKDGHYLKPYWPYIPLALIVGLGLIFSSFWGNVQNSVLSYSTNVSVNGLLEGTNAQRTANGLGALALNAQLNSAAQAKANDMVARNYWSHTTPDGQEPWVFIASAGYDYQAAGENLAYGFDSSDAAVTAWMNSPGHRANILHTLYQEVGFGFANSEDFAGNGQQTVVVAMYGAKKGVAAPAAAPAAQPAAPAPQPAAVPAPAAPAEVAESAPAPAPEQKPKPLEVVSTVAPTLAGAGGVTAPRVAETQTVSRIQLLTGGSAPWSVFAATVFAGVCLAIFLMRHALFWHRALVKGEAFIMHHPFLDAALVLIVVAGFVLTRTAGVIH